MIPLAKVFPGLLFTLLLAAIAWFASAYIPFVNSIMLGLLLGMLFGNVHRVSDSLQNGISLSSSKGLELSVIFLSFSINYRHFGQLGLVSFVLIGFGVFGLLIIARILAKKMNCVGTSGILIGFGTAICGSSAIAALAPQLKSNKTDTSMAIAVVNLFGTIFMLLFPFVLPYFGMSIADLGLIIGGSLHAVGNVAGAGFAISPEVGESAITVKLARVALLSPALLLMHFIMPKQQGNEEKVKFGFPWYLWGFLIITLINSLFNLPVILIETMKWCGDAVLTLAMVAIGLKVRIGELIRTGGKGLLFGIIIFLIFLALIVAGQQVAKYLL